MSADSLDSEGLTPTRPGQHMDVGEHSLVAEAGQLPANDLVWRCEFCDETNTGTGWYRRVDCEAGDGS